MVSRLFVLLMSLTVVALQSGCDNVVSPLTSGDTTWVQCQGLPFVTGFAASGNNLVAGSYNAYLSEAYVYISFDNGLTWTMDARFQVDNYTAGVPLHLPTPVTFLSYHGRLIAGIDGGHTGAIYISTDDGISWSNIGISWPLADTLSGDNGICFTASRQYVFAGTGYGVFRSTDNGMTWLSASNGLTYDHIDSVYGHPPAVMSVLAQQNNIYVGTQGGVFLSSNEGENWIPVNTGLTNLWVYSLSALGTTIFAGVFKAPADSIGGVFASSNSGTTWDAVDNGLTDQRVNVIASSEPSYLFAGTNSGLFVSPNDGMAWSYDSIGVPPQTLAVTYLAVLNSYLFVGTLHGVWRYPISRLSKAMESNEVYPPQKRNGG